eukprot:CAMPEP_0176370588 /NCGR_PEP_ID=MMETSP0126-20121128/24097_1 /TAXON_ID=141414 ORGANISM="Strombidinopsis acuminatum, Strain SPMC142" /NCGR_SAMPLE_ID=MMETSP0126 /ASSEMBLY_ACC=CAM_ASM_000229 /LENGTH=95 /DNA_ID=CAMNT_0017729693 /DNA_START=28 /DNA_END=315 /DNA_ORIENTATION=-
MKSSSAPNKKQKGGNSRLNKVDKTLSGKKNFSEEMHRVQNTEDIDELIELTRCEDENVRLKATQQMCPCRVKFDHEEFWNRIFELAEDDSTKVRY